MINSWVLIILSVAYWLILFLVAYTAEKRAVRGKGLSQNPYIYSLSLAVYCTAWTFFGSVGKVKDGGFDFLAVYLGPTIFMPLGWIILRKIIRICKAQRITTIADFISSRYGKNVSLASIITIFCFLGIIPYISLQLKAISESFNILTANSFKPNHKNGQFIFENTALMMAVGMAIFAVLFGTRKIEATERHEGMVAAIAFESIVKLVAFLAVGIFVCYGVFDGFGDIFGKAMQISYLREKILVPDSGGYGNWFWVSFLSGMAVFFLPRQFQVTVLENVEEKHLNKAIWLFPLYLLLINIFVLPIAFGGNLLFGDSGVDPDYFVLDIPLLYGQNFLAIIVFIGGYAAATGMIIVETIALSTMFSNHLVMPVILANKFLSNKFRDNVSAIIIQSRRLGIIFILTAAYIYYELISSRYSLVSLGLISFVSVAQLMPSIIGGIFWKRGNKLGALSGLVAGFIIWFYTLVLPSLAGSSLLPQSFVLDGPFGIALLKPSSLLGLEGFNPIVHSMFWSLLVNVSLYVGLSLFTEQSVTESTQAELFVNINKYASVMESAPIWKGTAYVPDIRSLLANFLGTERTNQALIAFSQRNKIPLGDNKADPKLVAYSERVLSGIIGSASARIMVASTVKEEDVRIDEVLDILKESQQLIRLNKELVRKTDELEMARIDLEEANTRLLEQDSVKDDFLTTVTHELRTPITSIRAFSEILHDNEDIELEERKHYLQIIIKETERISRLISQVLDLEKYDSGKQKLNLETSSLPHLLNECLESVNQLVKEKNLQLVTEIDPQVKDVWMDTDKMQQVIINLLSNAIKFAQTTIYVRLKLTPDSWILEVEDDGPGIPEDMGELIFEKFYQAKNQTIRKPKGSGLGLAISRRIVDLHEGGLYLVRTEKLGAFFYVQVPLTQKSLLVEN
ncbi:MAG: histidine kinase [Bacteroidetes bacterium B1(2017)]|nr:MAG: histidine kinase [Bacteroidetes bacterium B1(2017)]